MSIINAAEAVARALGDRKYAVVDGAACALLGSLRGTRDVDIVVPKGQTPQTRAVFRQSDQFVVDPKTAHTYYNEYKIEILEPPALFKEKFDESTPTVTISGVHILSPALILNAKCGSVPQRASDDKKRTDAADIKYLLSHIVQTGLAVAPEDVPNASGAFYHWFVGQYGEPELWTQAGYDTQKGWFSTDMLLRKVTY